MNEVYELILVSSGTRGLGDKPVDTSVEGNYRVAPHIPRIGVVCLG